MFRPHADYEICIVKKFGFVNHCHVVGASAETVRNISLVRKVRLEDVCRVGLDAVEEVIVGRVKQFGDGRHVIAAIAEPFPAMQERVKPHSRYRNSSRTMLARLTGCARRLSLGICHVAT